MKRIAAVVLSLLSASAAPAQDQKRDKEIVPPAPKAPPAATFGGVYQGTLTCQEIRGVTRAGYNFPLKLVVTDTQASYEREFRSDDGKRPLGTRQDRPFLARKRMKHGNHGERCRLIERCWLGSLPL